MLMCHVTLFVNTVAKNGRLEIPIRYDISAWCVLFWV